MASRAVPVSRGEDDVVDRDDVDHDDDRGADDHPGRRPRPTIRRAEAG